MTFYYNFSKQKYLDIVISYLLKNKTSKKKLYLM